VKPPALVAAKTVLTFLTMNTSYLPVSDNDRALWLNNFSSRLGQYRVALGLTQSEVNSVIADADMFAYLVQLSEATRLYTQAVTNMKKQARTAPQQIALPALPALPNIGNAPNTVNSGIFNRVTILVAIIKQHSAYSNTMGTDLGIVAPVTPFNPSTMTPDLNIRIESGFPLLRWKKGESDGVNIYVDRHDNNGFVLLRRTVRNSFLDAQPLPQNTYTATWDYKIRYLLEDDEVGNFSPVISINVFRAE
jgi:hypothetical protein